MKKLTRRAFMDWLRRLGDQPCGSLDSCPIWNYAGGVYEALQWPKPGWRISFEKWADANASPISGGWETIPASKALAFLEGEPEVRRG